MKFGFVAIPFNSIKLFIKNKEIGGWETKKNSAGVGYWK